MICVSHSLVGIDRQAPDFADLRMLSGYMKYASCRFEVRADTGARCRPVVRRPGLRGLSLF